MNTCEGTPHPGRVEPEPISWAAATWSVPAAVVGWLVTAMLVGLIMPDAGETLFFIVAAVIAAAMAVGGWKLSRSGGTVLRGTVLPDTVLGGAVLGGAVLGGAVLRGAGLGLACAGVACVLVAVLVAVR